MSFSTPTEATDVAIREGGCICRKVRFRTRGEPKWVVWCHCADCRRHTGAPASAYASFNLDAIELTGGEITKFASSPPSLRGFCGRCGSTLTGEADDMPGEVHFHIGAFDAPETLVPHGEAYSKERLPWTPPTGLVSVR